MPFRVRGIEGENVTAERKWLIDTEGRLQYLTGDAAHPLAEAGEGYWVEML